MTQAYVDAGRREAVKTLLGLGAVGLAGCAGSDAPAPGAIGTVAEALSGAESLVVVATRDDVQALAVPSAQQDGHTICYLGEPGREGVWKLVSGNFSDEVGLDD